MRAIFMGKHKRAAVEALGVLAGSGAEVALVIAPDPAPDEDERRRLDIAAEDLGVSVASEDELYEAAADGSLGEVDLVLSYLYPRRIRPPLIELPSVGCLNFHPAPLPDMRGLGGFNVAIVEGMPEWGVSAHFVDEEFDTGDLVRVDRFPIDPLRETALSLDLRSQKRLLALFEEVIALVLAGEPLPRERQGEGRYVTREEFESLRQVRPDDTPEMLERRIRAFWYPPHEGATIEVAGRAATLVDDQLLAEVARAYRDAGILP